MIDKYHPSSKICNSYHNEYEIKDKEVYKCSVCENVIDRDVNAVINILKKRIIAKFLM